MSKRQIERIAAQGGFILVVIQEGTPTLPKYLKSEDGTETTNQVQEAHVFYTVPEHLDLAKHYAYPEGWRPGQLKRR